MGGRGGTFCHIPPGIHVEWVFPGKNLSGLLEPSLKMWVFYEVGSLGRRSCPVAHSDRAPEGSGGDDSLLYV